MSAILHGGSRVKLGSCRISNRTAPTALEGSPNAAADTTNIFVKPCDPTQGRDIYPKITTLEWNSPPWRAAWPAVRSAFAQTSRRAQAHLKADMTKATLNPRDIEKRPRAAADLSGAIGSARRHSRRVRMLKLLLPAAAVLAVVAFVAASWFSSMRIEGVSLESASIQDGKLVMANPSIDGFTANDQPYKMTARRALQEIGGATQRIDLEGIEARLPLDSDTMAHVRAEAGVFDRDANTLDIESEILVETDKGMSARINTARLDLSSGSLETDQPVDIRMEGTQIRADSMTISNNGSVMVFDRKVRVEIDGRRLQLAQGERGDR